MEKIANKFLYSLKRTFEYLWYSRSYFPILNFPIKCRLPYGGRFNAYGDAMGARIVGYRWATHPYEQESWQFLYNFISPRFTIIDLGANQGFYTILASLRAPLGKVYAFEPHPTERAKLIKNLHLNNSQNVIVESLAVGNFQGSTSFHACFDCQGSFSSIMPPAQDVYSHIKIIRVPITTLDQYIKTRKIKKIDLLKVDVEGGELNVFKGGLHVLAKKRPMILCEIEAKRANQWGNTANEVLQFLKRNNYKCFTLNKLGKLSLIKRNYICEDGNVLAIAAEKVESVFERFK